MFKLTIFIAYFSSLTAYADIPIGVAWKGKSSMAERVYKSFLSGLGNSRDNFSFDERLALKSKEKFHSAIVEFEKSKKGVLLFRSNAFKYISKRPLKVPTFLGAGNNPIALGTTSSMKNPNKNATGVTYYIPLLKHFKIFKSIFPNMKSIALITEKGHPGSSVENSETKEQCIKYSLKCDFLSVNSNKNLMEQVKKLNKKSYDFIILGAEDLIMKNTKRIVKEMGNTPVLAYSSKPVKDGALIGFVASDKVLGHKLAKSFLKHFEQGKSISEIAFEVDNNPEFQINETTAKRLKLNIPFEVINAARILN